ncbi:MAG: MFS family permease [Limisphaerales bacterium]|jgi:MFS family permease
MLPLYALSTILMIGYAAVFTLLAEMRSSFGFSETAIGAIAGSAFLAGFIAQLVLSRFADSGHGKHLLRLGVVTALIGLVWMCFADDLTGWIAARTILGFGAGCVRPAARRLAFVHQPEVAGKTLGRLAAAEMIGFLIGPVVSSLLFNAWGIRAPFIALVVLLALVVPFVLKVEIPGSKNPLKNAMRTLIRRPAMQSCIALGVAFYLAIGVFDAIWAVYMADMGASQLFIGGSMSLFTLPMILIAPWAGSFAARTNAFKVVTVTMTMAMLAMITYGFVDSLWWLLLPLAIHATVDAVSMPSVQLAVGYASGETALASGQGLYGAAGLVVATIASFGSGAIYQLHGAQMLWWGTAALMGVCILVAWFRGHRLEWTGQSTSGLSSK